MKLLPSLKPKKRYIAFVIKTEDSQKFSQQEVQKVVEASLHQFLGDLGMSKAAPLFIKERYNDNKFILKVNHTYVDEAKSAIVLIKSIKNHPVIIQSLITSGTIRTAGSYISA